MFNFKNLFSILLISSFFVGFVAAQPPSPASSANSSNSSNKNQSKQNFVSLDGGFTIALPQQISGFRGIPPTAGVNKGGSQFTWTTSQGFFLIAYVDRILTLEEYKSLLQNLADEMILGMSNKSAKLISKGEILSNGNPAIEIKMIGENKEIGVSRFILVKNRLFFLSTGWKENEDGKEQLKILDSFKLIDSKAIIAQKLEEATPAPLPQSPIVKKLKTDAEDERLKGKVKTVTETEEDLTGTRSVSGIKMSYQDFYDESGNQVKHISYDYRGNPSEVTVYGSIDGSRVSKLGDYISYEYNPPPPAPPAPSPSSSMSSSAEKPKPVDNRYSFKYEYKYDEKGRLQEVIRYRNNGDMRGKTIYTYEGNKVDETAYDKDGKITFKTLETFDDKGNLIEKTYVEQNPKIPNSTYTYTYQSLDEKGNWIKRTVTGKQARFDGSFKEQNYIEYRTITYYP